MVLPCASLSETPQAQQQQQQSAVQSSSSAQAQAPVAPATTADAVTLPLAPDESTDVDKELLSLFMMASGDLPTPQKTYNSLPELSPNAGSSLGVQFQPAQQQQQQQQQQSSMQTQQNQQNQVQPTQQLSPSVSAGTPMTPPTTKLNAPYYDKKRAGEYVEGEDDERHFKRLARKAELARASRLRKKMYVQDLERKVQILGAQIEEMQNKQAAKRRSGSSLEDREHKASQNGIKMRLAELVRKPLTINDVRNVEVLVQQFVENSRARQSKVEHFLDCVSDCISPGLQVKFALWGLDQNDEFYEKPGLWSSLLSTEMGLSMDQMQRLKERRDSIHAQRQSLATAELRLQQLRKHISSHVSSLNHEIDELQNILSPVQLAKFYVWVEENEWCMQMLSSILQTHAQE